MCEKIDFDYEFMLQHLTNKRLKIIFDLEYIAQEYQFPGLTVDCLTSNKKTKNLKVDGLAFDKKTNSFVVLEYKNELNLKVLNQAEGYYHNLLQKDVDKLINRLKDQLKEVEEKKESENEEDFDFTESYELLDKSKEFYKNMLQENRCKLIKRYNKKFNENRVETDFDFSKVKVMIIGPKFLESQVEESEKLEYGPKLYDVSLYRCNDINGYVLYKGINVNYEKRINVNLGNLKYTRYTLLYNKSKEIKDLYNEFERCLLNHFNDLDVKYYIDLVAIKVQKEKICLLKLNQSSIKIEFNDDKIEDETLNHNNINEIIEKINEIYYLKVNND